MKSEKLRYCFLLRLASEDVSQWWLNVGVTLVGALFFATENTENTEKKEEQLAISN